MPIYQKRSLLESLIKKPTENVVEGYHFEILKKQAIYRTEVATKEELIELMRTWCVDRKEPNGMTYKKILFN